jgi:hypothetical protein
MINAMDRFIMAKDIVDTGPCELMKFMKMERLMKIERRIVGDAFQAYAAIALFYDTRAFAVSKYNKVIYNKLYRNEFRAIYPPDRRIRRSCTNMPKEFWKDFDKLEEDDAKAKRHIIAYVYPPEWSQVIRPIIVRLYKHGIIRPSYAETVRVYIEPCIETVLCNLTASVLLLSLVMPSIPLILTKLLEFESVSFTSRVCSLMVRDAPFLNDSCDCDQLLWHGWQP